MIYRFCVRAFLIASFLASPLFAEPPATQPTDQKNDGAKAEKSDRASSGDPKVDEILDKMENKGSDLNSLRCKLTYTFITPGPIEGLEDRQEKYGELYYVHGDTPRFLVHFTRKVADNVVNREAEYYAFDGRWYIERNDRAKTVVRREIARKGEKVDLFELGKGPFPLPFGRSREEILRHFDVKRQSFNVTAEKKPIHLRCLPRLNTDMADRYSYVDMIIDPETYLPAQVICKRSSDDSEIRVDFKEINDKAEIEDARFIVPAPANFQVTEEPLDKEAKPTGEKN